MKVKNYNGLFLRKLRKHWVPVIGVLLILFFSYYSFVTEGFLFGISSIETQTVTNFVKSFGALAGIVFVVLVILEVVIAPLHPLVLYIAGGVLFGAFLGGTLALLGNIIGAMIAFELTRKYGRSFIEKGINPMKRKKFDELSKKYGALAIFLLRINPITNSDVLSYMAGVTKMSRFSFVVATTLGLLPFVYIQTYLGEDLVRGSPFLISLVIVIGIIYSFLLMYGIWYAFRKGYKER